MKRAQQPSAIAALLFCLLTAAPGALRAQEQSTPDRPAAPAQLTQEEIERKLRELGISKEEAIRRAMESTSGGDERLRRDASAQLPRQTPDSTALPIPVPANPPPPGAPAIPGFSGRAGLDSTLRPFGYDIFALPASAFAPLTLAAAGPTYVLGPGDEVVLTLFGETKLSYNLIVNREGNVVIPDVGPVPAGGATIAQFRERAIRRLSTIYSSLGSSRGAATSLDVTLGRNRTLQIFVLGEVNRPGGYPLSAMSTVLHALYEAGGPTVNGSMRRIAVSRNRKRYATVDLYEYVTAGEQSSDVRLQDGDVVYVPPAGKRVALQGAVARPGIFEIRDGEQLGNLLALGGGVRFDAYADRVHVERIVPFDLRPVVRKEIQDIDLRFESVEKLRASDAALESGDVVTVFSIKRDPANRVTITGNVRKPGNFSLQYGMRVSDLVRTADSLDRNTFADRALLFRLHASLRRELIAFHLGRAMQGDPVEDMLLQNEDSVVVFAQDRFFPQRTVTISGAVRFPGTYVRNDGMSVTDLILQAGGIREEGMSTGIEVSTADTASIEVYSTVHRVDLPAAYWSDRGEREFLLQDLDHVVVPFDPRHSPQQFVDISGYVMFPGRYAILNANERLSSLIRRAGGLKPGAYLEASRLVRKRQNAGMIPVDFVSAWNDTLSRDNITLYPGDSVTIAYLEDVVYVRGEVFVPSAILYKKGAGMEYYVQNAGGYTEEAEDSRTLVFLPSGKKWEPASFFFPDPEILPGSAIYVPRKVEKPDTTLPIIRDILTITASLAAIIVSVVAISK